MRRRQRNDQMQSLCLKIFSVFFLLAITSKTPFSQTRTLEGYLSAARRYSATLIDYQNQLLSLGYDSSKIRSTFLPKINFTTQAMIAPVIGGFGYDSALSN